MTRLYVAAYRRRFRHQLELEACNAAWIMACFTKDGRGPHPDDLLGRRKEISMAGFPTIQQAIDYVNENRDQFVDPDDED